MNDQQKSEEQIPMEAYQETLPAVLPTPVMVEVKDSVITARKVAVPRDPRLVQQNLKILAAMAGEDWYYRWPVKNKDGSKGWVEGPSVKCAQAVARVYGNCRVDCAVRDTGTHILFEATFIDYETGYSLTRPFQQRKQQNLGKKMDADRQADIVFQIGVSKATRNVICNALETFADFAMDEAKNSLIDKIGKNLEKSRARMLELLKQNNVDLARVEFAYQKKSAEWLAPEIAKMHAEIKAVMDGMASPEETYPPTPEQMATEEKKIDQEVKQEKKKTDDDLSGQIESLIIGLEGCADEKSVNGLIDENEGILKLLDQSGSQDLKKKWFSAYQKKTAPTANLKKGK